MLGCWGTRRPPSDPRHCRMGLAAGLGLLCFSPIGTSVLAAIIRSRKTHQFVRQVSLTCSSHMRRVRTPQSLISAGLQGFERVWICGCHSHHGKAKSCVPLRSRHTPLNFKTAACIPALQPSISCGNLGHFSTRRRNGQFPLRRRVDGRAKPLLLRTQRDRRDTRPDACMRVIQGLGTFGDHAGLRAHEFP